MIPRASLRSSAAFAAAIQARGDDVMPTPSLVASGDVLDQPCDAFPSHAGSSAAWTIAAASFTDVFAAKPVAVATPAASLVMRRVAAAAYPASSAAVVFSAVAIADFRIYWRFGGGNRGSVRSAAISILIKSIDAATATILPAAEQEFAVIGLCKGAFDVRNAALDGPSVTLDGPNAVLDGCEWAFDVRNRTFRVREVALNGCGIAFHKSNVAPDGWNRVFGGLNVTVDQRKPPPIGNVELVAH